MFAIVLDFDWMGHDDPVRVVARAATVQELRDLPCFDPDSQYSYRRGQLAPQEQISVSNCATGGTLPAHICSVAA